jgi:hypothetical protein
VLGLHDLRRSTCLTRSWDTPDSLTSVRGFPTIRAFSEFPGSSVVERRTVNPLVGGSNPSRGAIKSKTYKNNPLNRPFHTALLVAVCEESEPRSSLKIRIKQRCLSLPYGRRTIARIGRQVSLRRRAPACWVQYALSMSAGAWCLAGQTSTAETTARLRATRTVPTSSSFRSRSRGFKSCLISSHRRLIRNEDLAGATISSPPGLCMSKRELKQRAHRQSSQK